MVLARLTAVSKAFGSAAILENASLELAKGRRVGFVGRNGTGKTTVLRLLMGEIEPDAGEVWRHRNARFAMMSQIPTFEPGSTPALVARAAFQSLLALSEEAARIRDQLAAGDQADHDALLARLADLDEAFEHGGGFEVDYRIRAVLGGLGFAAPDFDKPVEVLSGGEKNRLALARILLQRPDVLLLDEPTNHLDLDGIEWLESYLGDWKGALLVISHDRFLLETVTTETLDLAQRALVAYPAPYRRAMEMKGEVRRVQEKQYRLQREEIERQEEFVRRNIAGQNFRQAQARRKWLARVERLERPEGEERPTRIRIAPQVRTGNDVLTAARLRIVVAGRELVHDATVQVRRGDRIGILGPNGSGKTTLLATLSGRRRPDDGSVLHGTGVQMGFLDQELRMLHGTNTVIEEVHAICPLEPAGEVRSYLARFLFSGDEVFRPISVLSGGERCRLALAKLFLHGPNLLFLDEPTNHLDIDGREALEVALAEYEGTVLLVSHDRAFLTNVAAKIWHLHDGRLDRHLGGYAEFIRHRAGSIGARGDAPASGSGSSNEPEEGTDRSRGAERQEARKRERRAREREAKERDRRAAHMASLESNIADVDAELNTLVAELSRADLEPDARRTLTERHAWLELKKQDHYAEWERLVENDGGTD